MLLLEDTVYEQLKYPTSGTQSNDAFVLQGDTAVEDVTIKDFYYNSGANTGYGFRFSNNFRGIPRSLH